jgi:hypothetical protein
VNFAEGGRSAERRVFVDRPRRAFGVVHFLHSPKMHLAQELVDYIIDFLHNDQAELSNECLSYLEYGFVALAHISASP